MSNTTILIITLVSTISIYLIKFAYNNYSQYSESVTKLLTFTAKINTGISALIIITLGFHLTGTLTIHSLTPHNQEIIDNPEVVGFILSSPFCLLWVYTSLIGKVRHLVPEK